MALLPFSLSRRAYALAKINLEHHWPWGSLASSFILEARAGSSFGRPGAAGEKEEVCVASRSGAHRGRPWRVRSLRWSLLARKRKRGRIFRLLAGRAGVQKIRLILGRRRRCPLSLRRRARPRARAPPRPAGYNELAAQGAGTLAQFLEDKNDGCRRAIDFMRAPPGNVAARNSMT